MQRSNLIPRKERERIVSAPNTPAFVALSALAPIITRVPVSEGDLNEYGYNPGVHILVPTNDVEALLHELAHWAIASPARRLMTDYGLDGYAYAEIDEQICGWLQQDLYERAGVTMPASSVHTTDFEGSPWLRPVALRRWRRAVKWPQRLAVVEALRLPGGDVGLWS